MDHSITNSLKNNDITVNGVPIRATKSKDVGSVILSYFPGTGIPIYGFNVSVSGTIPSNKTLYYQEGNGSKHTETANSFQIPLPLGIQNRFKDTPPNVTVGDEEK